MADPFAYDEFGLFHENAAEFALPYHGAPTVRRQSTALPDGRELSSLVWGDGPAELVLIHGGAQNAHTWDTVALALGRPLLAVDLPGHGHSGDVATLKPGQLRADSLADDVAVAIAELAPAATVVVGMSLGGMTAMCLADRFAELVRRLVLVDVTPGVTAAKAKAITDFVNGPATFADFDAILARTVEHNATRSVSSLRRGILHNALQQPDGAWVWRHRRFASTATPATDQTRHDYGPLWDRLGSVRMPVMLVRGMQPQSVVDDGDETEFRRRLPDAVVARVDDAGHSVQGDTPLELARLIEQFAPAGA